jgi:hypothetical protein
VIYTNRITGEKLTDRIDLQIKTALDQTSMRLSYKVDSPLDTLFDPESVRNYGRLSQFLWRLKCCEYHLTANWKKARHQTVLTLVGDDSGLARRQIAVRHKLLTTIRALNEFFSTDVVLASGRGLEASIAEASDIDTLIKKHHLHVNGLMKGTFLSNDSLEHHNAIGLLIETINLYADLEDEIEETINRMLDEIESAENFEEEGDAFIRRIRNELADEAFQISQVNHEFDDRLDAVYRLTARRDAPTELQRLEVRLQFCIQSPARETDT